MRLVSVLFLVLLAGFHTRAAQAQITSVPPDTLHAIYNMGPAFGGNGTTIVEFYDYQCGYCKADEEILTQLLQEDSSLHIVYMDFPKLGPLSEIAARATLASLRQGTYKYLWFYHILMNKDVHVTEDMIYAVAEKVGLNVTQLRQDMNDPAIA